MTRFANFTATITGCTSYNKYVVRVRTHPAATKGCFLMVPGSS